MIWNDEFKFEAVVWDTAYKMIRNYKAMRFVLWNDEDAVS